MANDVAYRLNTGETVKKWGTILEGTNKFGDSQIYRGHEGTVPNELPAATGLVDRFDDPKYYSA